MKRLGVLLAVVFFIVSLSGCVTTRSGKVSEVEALKNRILALETELDARDEEIASLKSSFSDTTQKRASQSTKKTVGEVKSRPKVKQIQIALRNAGFDPGPADGKMGKRTRSAVRTFQKANGLMVDGKVGKQTWAALSKYFDQKIK